MANLHILVSLFHAEPLVVIGSTSGHGDKISLPCSLLVHVGVLEKLLGAGVTEHVDIELINN